MKKSILIFSQRLACCALCHSSVEAAPANPTTNQGDTMNSVTTYNICNTDLIYNKDAGFTYSLPRTILESYLAGKAFDNPTNYSEEEAQNLCDDINDIYQAIMSQNPVKGNIAVMTAGAPGAGKSVKMNQDLAEQKENGTIFAYIDPDDVCLKQYMDRTYKADPNSSADTKEGRLAAYNKWRPASNAANHLVLANLIREKFSFYFGTTSTGDATKFFYDFLKKHGYQVRLIHVSAPDDVRVNSIKERDKNFVQTTDKDIEEKGLMLPRRINDTYLKYADTIEFCYRGAVNENAVLAATWIRNPAGEEMLGILQVHDKDRYEKIKAIHNAALDTLNEPALKWDVTVEAVSDVIIL